MRAHLTKGRVVLFFVFVAAVATSTLVTAYFEAQSVYLEAFRYPDFEDHEWIAPGYSARIARAYDEEVSAITTVAAGDSKLGGFTYVGTSPRGTVHFFSSTSTQPNQEVLGDGLGEQIRHGTCNVNAIAVKDIDGDGDSEVLVSTSQILPRGKPRLFVYGSGMRSEIRSVARPGIQSSWSHGLGFLPDPDGKSNDVFITFCGFGEIVEYRPAIEKNEHGFTHDAMKWKQVGQLPASGEWLQSADVDNDGSVDLCVATGYAERKAAVHVYHRDRRGDPLVLRHKIEEDSKFGNVFFFVGNTSGDGTNELIAWWCTEIAGGDCEMIKYRLDKNGVTSRVVLKTGPALEMMPHDGQTARHDLDGDGRDELWFGTWSGRLWKYDPTLTTPLVEVLKLKSVVGPVASYVHNEDPTQSGLYFGSGKNLVLLTQTKPDPSREKRGQALASRSDR